MGSAEVELADVSISFGKRTILSNFDLTLRAAESTALMGPSGAGKSSLLAVVSGLVPPSAGRRSSRNVERVSWIFQTTPILSARSALDNVVLGPLSQGAERSDAEERSLAAMHALGVADLAQNKAFRLSGGERQRLVVARAMATDSNLIIADEPTASLDRNHKHEVCDALLAASAQGAIVIVATHDADVAARLDRTVELAKYGE